MRSFPPPRGSSRAGSEQKHTDTVCVRLLPPTYGPTTSQAGAACVATLKIRRHWDVTVCGRVSVAREKLTQSALM